MLILIIGPKIDVDLDHWAKKKLIQIIGPKIDVDSDHWAKN